MRGESAQRLSASKISSDHGDCRVFRLVLCSTPFGIKDQFGDGQVSGEEWGDLCSTPFGIKDQFGQPLGQRPPLSIRAQRLSASKISSEGNLGRCPKGHVCSTPFGIKDQFGK